MLRGCLLRFERFPTTVEESIVDCPRVRKCGALEPDPRDGSPIGRELLVAESAHHRSPRQYGWGHAHPSAAATRNRSNLRRSLPGRRTIAVGPTVLLISPRL